MEFNQRFYVLLRKIHLEIISWSLESNLNLDSYELFNKVTYFSSKWIH